KLRRMSGPSAVDLADGQSSKSVYERKFEALFGPVRAADNVPAVFRGENLFPVAMATLILSVGWVVVVQPETIFNVGVFPPAVGAVAAVQIPLETLRFGFLGAYFYLLQMLVR